MSANSTNSPTSATNHTSATSAEYPLPLKKSTTRLVAQILTYYYNGIVDAKVTQEFVSYFQTSGKAFQTENTTTQMRAQALLEAGDINSPDYLIGLAFTIYRTNGYGNYIMGVRMQNALKSPYKDEIDQLLAKYNNKLETILNTYHDYKEEKDGWMPFFGFWLENSMLTFRQAQEFAKERFGYEEKLDKREVVRACLAVQKQNSAHNLDVARRILENEPLGDPKIIFLHQAAQEVEKTSVFLESCAMTQRIQANSDKALVGLLKVRFPRAWVSLPELPGLPELPPLRNLPVNGRLPNLPIRKHLPSLPSRDSLPSLPGGKAIASLKDKTISGVSQLKKKKQV